MGASDYVNIDNTLETGESLTDDSILDLVKGSRPADDVTINDDADDADDDEPEPVVKRIEARKGLAQAIRYCEQNPALGTHLDSLWKAMRSIETYSDSGVQKSMLDFISLR